MGGDMFARERLPLLLRMRCVARLSFAPMLLSAAARPRWSRPPPPPLPLLSAKLRLRE